MPISLIPKKNHKQFRTINAQMMTGNVFFEAFKLNNFIYDFFACF